jgi:hypothetical protein
MERDLKWHGYESNLEVKSLEAFFGVVERDEFGCFFGQSQVPVIPRICD